MNDKDEVLAKVKELLKDELTAIAYETWIKNLEIESINDNEIILVTFSIMQKDTLESRLYDLVTNTFNYVTNRTCKIKIIQKDSNQKNNNKKIDTNLKRKQSSYCKDNKKQIMSDKEELLNEVKWLLKEEMATISYTTWIKSLEIESINILLNATLKNTEFSYECCIFCYV